MVAASPAAGLLRRLERLVFAPLPGRQGAHIDPLQVGAPNQGKWHRVHRQAFESVEMVRFREALCIGNLDVRASVLHDLSAYYGMTVEEALDRCINWEVWSNSEWKAADRSTPEGLQDFYQTVRSWSFDLLWYAYLQSEGHGFPASVAAVRFAQSQGLSRDHLDFGSGIGATGQVFSRLGYATTLADVSKSLLDFARWRLEQRGDKATYIHLAVDELPSAGFDIVTALDTLVHVPDVSQTARALHRALRPGGWLLANFDVRASSEIPWHLHENRIRLERDLLAAGFVARASLGEFTRCYERVELNGPHHRAAFLRASLAAPVQRARFYAGRLRGRYALERLKRRLAGHGDEG